jgi:hypothetical protein
MFITRNKFYISEDLLDAMIEGRHALEQFHESKPKEHDPVNHPSHYTSHPSGVECIKITEHYNFCIGNAIKYLWRNGLKTSPEKNTQIEDLKKAIWYIQKEINNLESGTYERV